MREVLKYHISDLLHYWWTIVPPLMAGLIGLGVNISRSLTGSEPTIPLWAWIAIALAGIPIAQFLAYRKVAWQRDNVQSQLDRLRDGLLGNLSVDHLRFGSSNLSEDSIDIQPGIRLLNSADVPIQYNVTEFSAIVANLTVPNPQLRMRTGIIQSGRERLFLYAVIPNVPNTFPTTCILKYTVRYGPLAEEHTHELSEALTVSLHRDETQSGKVNWVYLVDASDYRRL